MTPTPEALPPLPEPFDYCYEWDGPFGTRKFSAASHNGMNPARSVPLFTADQMRAYARAALAAKQWQPLSTMPLRETVILLIGGKHVTTGDKWPGIGITWNPCDDEADDDEATAWQPLPQPPKE